MTPVGPPAHKCVTSQKLFDAKCEGRWRGETEEGKEERKKVTSPMPLLPPLFNEDKSGTSFLPSLPQK